MSTTQEQVAPTAWELVRRRDTAWGRFRKSLVRDRVALVGVVLVAILVLVALLAPLIAPSAAEGLGRAHVSQRSLAPGAAHWFGTDELGRDVLSRVIMGTRPALMISVFVVALAMLIGIPIGALAGYKGGWIDDVMTRVTELFQAFPPLLLAMVIVALRGPGLLNAGLALAVSWWPWYARLVRAEAMSLRGRPFVEAARSMGVSTRTILRRHIVSNSLGPVLVQATVDIGSVTLAAGSLAFLGLGTRPPAPDWGLMVADGRVVIFDEWWISTFPGLAIFLAVLAFNLLGDALRDVLDPRSIER
jgi:peptide/nickel transport system permease protein